MPRLIAKNLVVPPELRGKVSPALVQMAEARVGWWALGMAFAIFGSLEIPMLVSSVRNGYLYLLGPCLSPFITTTLLTAFPLHPYRGILWVTRTRSIDVNDPVSVRLGQLYNSRLARCHLWEQAAKFSGTLLVIVEIMVVLLPRAPAWLYLDSFARWTPPVGFELHELWGTIFCTCLGSFLVLACEVHAWCLRTWVAQETSPQ
jgi:hypothetical protein